MSNNKHYKIQYYRISYYFNYFSLIIWLGTENQRTLKHKHIYTKKYSYIYIYKIKIIPQVLNIYFMKNFYYYNRKVMSQMNIILSIINI